LTVENVSMEKKKVIDSIMYPVMFIVVIWAVKLVETIFHLSFYTFGIFPLSPDGLKGILFSPFIHGDFKHLISNTLPLLILGTSLFYFYRVVAFRVLIFSWLVTGVWVWAMARPSFHIGASGVIYSLAAFMFASGVIRKHPRLMAISLLVVFLYGGMVWGILPLKEHVSWESHLMGMLCGLLLAWFFRAYGPQRNKYSWELEEDMQEDQVFMSESYDNAEDLTVEPTREEQNPADNDPSSQTGNIRYRFDYKDKQQDT
jgi:membrane associated rhomboid family serine protease